MSIEADKNDVTTDDNTEEVTVTEEQPTEEVTVTEEQPVEEVSTEVEETPHHVTTEEKTLSEKIDELIQEAKKRKIAETNEIHFLTFLTKSQVDAFYEMSSNDRETIVSYINENKKKYYSAKDVLVLMDEALAVKSEPIEVRLLKAMPETVKVKWDLLDESSKNRIINQSRLHPDLTSDIKIEHFWLTRDFSQFMANENKTLIDSNGLVDNSKLSDQAVEAIMNKFKRLS